MTIKIVLADDHIIMREGLKTMLAREKDIEVVGEADDGLSVIKLVKKLEPDVTVLDVSMPNMNGIQATQHIVDEVPGTKVLALSMHSDNRFVKRMILAGAAGYILKYCALEELVLAVRAIAKGDRYYSKEIAGALINDYIDILIESDSIEGSTLTARQLEILQMIAEGQRTADIADRLCVSVRTVESHRKNIMDKLDLHTVAEITKYAIREGLTSIEH